MDHKTHKRRQKCKITPYEGHSAFFYAEDGVLRRVILWRYAQYKGIDVAANGTVLPDFPDRGQIATWAGEAVSWAYSRGVMTGKAGGKLDPNGNASRAEAAVMLYRFMKLSPNGEQQ